MNLLTNSRLKARRLCPTYHHLTYDEGWRPSVESSALTFGSAFHAGMEFYWQMQEIPKILLDDPFENARLQALLDGYCIRWAESDAVQYSTIAVEKEFTLPLVHPVLGTTHPHFMLAGKIDLLAQEEGDDLYVLGEHKTSNEDISIGAIYWRRLDLDTQILLYKHAMEMLGFPVRRILYDVAGKPKHRPKKGETPQQFQARIMEAIAVAPQEYYARLPLERTQAQVDRALIDAWDWADKMVAERAEGWHPRNPDACFKYNRPCAMFDYCSGLKALEEMPFIRVENVHAELSATCNQEEAA